MHRRKGRTEEVRREGEAELIERVRVIEEAANRTMARQLLGRARIRHHECDRDGPARLQTRPPPPHGGRRAAVVHEGSTLQIFCDREAAFELREREGQRAFQAGLDSSSRALNPLGNDDHQTGPLLYLHQAVHERDANRLRRQNQKCRR